MNNAYCNVKIAQEKSQIEGRITEGENTCTLEFLNVNCRHYRQGIGSNLLNQFITKAKKAGCRHVVAEVFYRNIIAIRFYKSHGFKIEGYASEEYLSISKKIEYSDQEVAND